MADSKQAKFDLVVGAVDNFSAKFKNMTNSINKKTEGIRRLQTSCQALNRETGLLALGSRFSSLGKAGGSFFAETKNYFGTLLGMGAKISLLFGGVGGGLFALATSTANAGDIAAKTAQRAGVGITTWQEYAHAASLCGASNETLEKSFRKLTQNAFKAAEGGKEQVKWWKRAGINIKTTNGQIKNSDQLFMELADKVKALNEAGQQGKAIELAKALFGEEDGAKLIPMLSAGSKGMKEMREEAHKLGLVLDAESGKQAEEFNDSLTRVQGGLRGLGFIIGKEVLPFATELIKNFTNLIIANREFVQIKVKEWVNSFKNHLPKLIEDFKGIATAIGKLIHFAGKFADMVGGWGNVFLIFAAIAGAKVVMSLVALGQAFVMLGATIMATPIGWVIAGLAAVTAAGYAFYKNWDSITASFNSSTAKIKGAWGAVTSYFEGSTAKVRAAFERDWQEGIVAVFANFHPLRLVADGMSALVNYFFGVDLYSAGDKLITSFGKGLADKWDFVKKWFSGKIAEFADMLPDWLKGQLGINVDAGNSDPQDPSRPTFGAPVGGMEMARSSQETKSTHIEKTQVEMIVSAKDGAGVEVRGGNIRDVSVINSSSLIGYQGG